MRTFRYRMTTPPGGYRYQVPFSNEEILAGDFAQLVNKVRVAYARNKVTPPVDLAARIEHYICLSTNEQFCTGEYEPGDAQARVGTVSDISRTSSDISNVRMKMSLEEFLVPPPDAERRAKVCAACSCNSHGFCTNCHGLAKHVVKAIGDRTTTLDSRLGICSVCSCDNRAKIHVSKKALQLVRRPPNEGKYPDTCWLVQEGVIPHG